MKSLISTSLCALLVAAGCKTRTYTSSSSAKSLGFYSAKDLRNSVGAITSSDSGSNHGTGFVIANDGKTVFVMTNAHVYEGCESSDKVKCKIWFSQDKENEFEKIDLKLLQFALRT